MIDFNEGRAKSDSPPPMTPEEIEKESALLAVRLQAIINEWKDGAEPPMGYVPPAAYVQAKRRPQS